MLPASLLDDVRPRMRPLLWHALAELVTTLERSRVGEACVVHAQEAAWHNFTRRHRMFRGAWARTPELAGIGFELLSRDNAEHMRIEACVWLTEFPSRATVEALAQVALDPGEPVDVRDQAAWSLGYRQLQQVDDALFWTPEVVAAADEALLALWRARPDLDQLASALRHVASPALLDAFAEDVIAAAPAIECFATPKLAQALLARLEELPVPDAPRLVRLVADTLGAEVVPELLARTVDAPLATRIEALFAALALDAATARPHVEAFAATLRFDRAFRERAAYHEAHPGEVAFVSALRVARTTATIAPAERTARCHAAASELAALAKIEPFAEGYLYSFFRHLAFASRDDTLVIACVESGPSMLEDGPFLVAPYLDALARAGRFDRLMQVARAHAATARATWLLATQGRPFSALAARRLAAQREVEAVAGGALALFLAGRPDLAEVALTREKPRSENLFGEGIDPFPGPDERWRLAHEPERWPALAALSAGVPGLLGAMRGAPDGADADTVDFALIAEREKDLRRDLAGTSVCLLGTWAATVRAALEAEGARLVDGPFGRTDFFLAAADADPAAVGRLRTLGVRELTFPL
jgi:hypothetical protein